MPEGKVAYLSPKLEVRPQLQKGGHGVFATAPVHTGEVVAVWGGEVIEYADFAGLPTNLEDYSLQVEENLYLAPHHAPEPADYINHSCEPNVGMSGQIVLVAMRDIAPDEEICFDYAMSEGDPKYQFDCACSAPNCRGRITGDDWRRPELWERYAGFFSPYLQRRIDRLKKEAGIPVQKVRPHRKVA